MRGARVLLLLAAAWPGAVAADPLALRAVVATVYDSNLFRLPEGLSVPDGRSDLIVQAQAGVRGEANLSLQRIAVDAAVTQNRFTRHNELSFTGINASGTWFWQVADTLSGRAGYDHQRRQTSFAEIRTGGRNIVTARQPFFEARLQPGRALFAYGGYTYTDLSNSLALLRISDFQSDIYTAGLGYQLHNGAEIKIGGRRTDTRFPNNQAVIIGGVPVSLRNDYRQDEVEGTFLYPFSAKTLVRGRVAYTERKVEQATSRNFTGVTGSVTFAWQPSELLTFQVTPRRDVNGQDDIQTNFVTADRLTGSVTWRPKRYFTVDLSADRAKRTFKGFALAAPTAGRRDQDRVYALGASYQWRLGRRLDVGVRREKRDSTLNILDYRTTIATGSLTLVF